MTKQGHEADKHPHHHDIDADAVCGQCGQVNEEGVLYCHKCGNNLRDQRHLRLEAEELLMHQGYMPQRRQWFLGALGTIGLIIILIAGFRADRIAEWMLEVQDSAPDTARLLWTGIHAERYATLLNRLDAEIARYDSLTDVTYHVATDFPEQGTLLLTTEEEVIGVAAVEQFNDLLFFVARLYTGEEIRGRAAIRGEWLVVDYNAGGVRSRRNYFPAAGAALLQPAGYFECFGQRDGSDITYAFMAYLVTQS